MRVRLFLAALFPLCTAGIFQRAVADTIWFETGRSLEGVIVEEAPDQIVFKQGVGQMTIPRNLIKKIEYCPSQENATRDNAWRKQHFYAEEYAPAELADLAAAFRTLNAERSIMLAEKRRSENGIHQARIAEANADRLQTLSLTLREQYSALEPSVTQYVEQRKALEAKIRALVNEINELGDDSGATDRRAELIQEHKVLVRFYQDRAEAASPMISTNERLIKQINQTALEFERGSEQIRQGQVAHSRIQEKSYSYVNSIAKFRSCFEQYATPRNRAIYPDFFDGIDTELEKIRLSVKTESAPISKNNNSLIVTVRINDELEVPLVLDTGATITTISKALATRLGIDLAGKPTGSSVLADGNVVPITYIKLDSIAVGSAIRQDVPVAVLDKPPGSGADGLLGMSFLKHFIIQLNIDNQKVELIPID